MNKTTQTRFMGALIRSLEKWMKIYPNPKSNDFADTSSNKGKHLYVERLHNHNSGALSTSITPTVPTYSGIRTMVKLDCNFEPFTQRRMLQLRVGDRLANVPNFVSTEAFSKGTSTKTIQKWLEDQFTKAAERN